MHKLSRNNRRNGRKMENRTPHTAWAWWLMIPAALALMAFSPWKRTLENFFYPYLVLPAHGTEILSESTLLLRSKSDLAAEVRRLQRENFELARQADRAVRLAGENRDLRALLQLAPPPGIRYVACDVVLRDPWLWEGGFTIGRGSQDGIVPGAPVIAATPDANGRAVLLGVVESVSLRSARVISVLNPEFRLSVRLPESDAVGFLNAADSAVPSGGAAVDFLPANTAFALHEPVYTTGFEALIPAGLLVGSLQSVAPAALPFGNRLYRSAVMRPAADLQKMRTVMVSCPAPGGGENAR